MKPINKNDNLLIERLRPNHKPLFVLDSVRSSVDTCPKLNSKVIDFKLPNDCISEIAGCVSIAIEENITPTDTMASELMSYIRRFADIEIDLHDRGIRYSRPVRSHNDCDTFPIRIGYINPGNMEKNIRDYWNEITVGTVPYLSNLHRHAHRLRIFLDETKTGERDIDIINRYLNAGLFNTNYKQNLYELEARLFSRIGTLLEADPNAGSIDSNKPTICTNRMLLSNMM